MDRLAANRGRPCIASRRRGARVVLWVAVGLASGCDSRPAGTESLIEHAAPDAVRSEQLIERFGCDETFIAKNPWSTAVLAVRVPGLLTRALEAGLPYREELEAGGPRLDIRFEQGADLDHWCTDMMARPPRIDAAWIAREGTAAVTVLERLREPAAAQPGFWRGLTRASVELIGVILERQGPDGETLELPGLTIEATIGEPAGG